MMIESLHPVEMTIRYMPSTMTIINSIKIRKKLKKINLCLDIVTGMESALSAANSETH